MQNDWYEFTFASGRGSLVTSIARGYIDHTQPKFCDVKELCASPMLTQSVGVGVTDREVGHSR